MKGQGFSEIELDIGRRGKGHIDLRGLAVLPQKRMQVAAVFGEDKADNIMARQQRVAAPFANEEGERVRVRIARAGEELRVLENDGDFQARLAGAGDGGEVRGVTQED